MGDGWTNNSAGQLGDLLVEHSLTPAPCEALLQCSANKGLRRKCLMLCAVPADLHESETIYRILTEPATVLDWL